MEQRRNNRRMGMILAATTCVGYAHMTEAATFNASWIGPDSSVYNNAAHWSTGVVPNNGSPSASSYYNVIIAKSGGAIVGGNVPAQALNLTIGAGSYFIPQSEKEFTLIGTANHGSCTIANNGTLGVTQAIPYSRLTLNAATTSLVGSGTVSILNGIISGTSTLINTSNTIVGRGDLGKGSLTIINHGTIIGRDTNAPNQTLYIDPSAAGMTNTGTMLASQGNLYLLEGSYNNTNGYISAVDGTVMIGSGATVASGSIHAANLGTVTLYNGNILGSTLTSAGGGRFRVPSGATSTIMNVTSTGSFVVESGGTAWFAGSNVNIGTILVQPGGTPGTLRVAGGDTTTFAGLGRIRMDGGRVLGNGTLLNSSSHTILGFGSLGIGTTAIVNNGTITASNGKLSINPAPGAAGMVNNGTMIAASGAGLDLAAGRTFDSTGGSVAVASTGSLLIGGTLNAGSIANSGSIYVGEAVNAGNIDGIGSLNLVMPSSTATIDRFRGYSLLSVGTLTIAPGGTGEQVSRIGTAPSLLGSGRIDLNDNALVVDYLWPSPIETIREQIGSGYNSGAWDGPGLTSSTAAANPGRALGYAEASATYNSFPATFMGQSVDDSTVLVKYTYSGDSNLDGVVDVADLGALASNWQTSAVWTGGDFNYDGLVDVADLGLLASNWQAGANASAPVSFSAALAAIGLGSTSVPEPAALGIIAAGAWVTLGRQARSPRSRSRSCPGGFPG